MRPVLSVGRYGKAACINIRGPSTFTRYWRSNSSVVTSAMDWFFATPALLTMISIWNFPVLGCEKWFLDVLTMCAAPPGDPTSACTIRHCMP